MQNIFKLIVVHIRLQQISYCYRWIHVAVITQRVRNRTNLKLYVTKSLQLSDGVVSEQVKFTTVYDNPFITFAYSRDENDCTKNVKFKTPRNKRIKITMEKRYIKKKNTKFYKKKNMKI